MTQRPYSKRFLAALAASCLAHGALLLSSAPGSGKKVVRSVVMKGLQMGEARPLNVTLLRERKPVVTIALKEGESTGSIFKAPLSPLPPAPITEDTKPIAKIAKEAGPPNQPAQPVTVENQQLAPERNALAPPLPLPAPTFFTTDQLTKRPELLSDPPKLEVSESMPAFTSGKVVLKVWINERGAVISVELEDSDVPDAVAAAATAAFEKLRFEPGEINGRPVATLMRIEVSYDEDLAQP